MNFYYIIINRQVITVTETAKFS